VLTAGNGLVILALASVGGVLPGYGVSAIMLLFAYGFVSRTRFPAPGLPPAPGHRRHECESRGPIDLRGHGQMQTYTIIGPRIAAVPAATGA
jgi:hypothetical protein